MILLQKYSDAKILFLIKLSVSEARWLNIDISNCYKKKCQKQFQPLKFI